MRPAIARSVVSGDAEELRTVVTNLLDNAVKYSGHSVQVTVSVAAPAPDTVWIRVQDRGVGIPRKQLKRIFNRFYRVQARGLRNIKGTGPRAVHRALDRPRAWRTCFRAERRRRPRRHVHARIAETRSPSDMTRILIVEDEQHIADGLRFNLEAEGLRGDRRP